MKQVTTLAGCLMVGLVFGSSAWAYTLTGTLRQLNDDLASPTYEASFVLTDFQLGTPTDDAELTLVSPSGTRFEEVDPLYDLVFASLKDVASTEVDALVAGVWAIEEVKGTTTHRYEFSIPPLAAGDIWEPMPRIVSPLDGSTVGPEFSVITSPADQYGFSYLLAGLDHSAGERVEISYAGNGAYEFSFAHIPGFQTAQFHSLRATSQVRVPVNVAGVTPGANSTFLSTIFAQTASPSIELTVVVPEPATLALTACGLLAAMTYRTLARARRLFVTRQTEAE